MNTGLLSVSLDVFIGVNDKVSVVNPRSAPGGGVRSQMMGAPLMVQVKRTVSSGHAALVLDVKVPVKVHVFSKQLTIWFALV